MSSNRIAPMELSSIDYNDILAYFKPINLYGFSRPCTRLRITNYTNASLLISYDGSTLHEFIGIGAELDVDFQMNSSLKSAVSMFEKGTIVYVARVSVAPKLGSLKLIAYGTNV